MPKFLKKKRFWIIAAAVAVLLIVLSSFLFKKAPAETFTTEPVKRGRVVQTVSATGMVESAHEITLNFKSPGRIVEQKAKQGMAVKAGDILVRIESRGISAVIKSDEAALASAKANLAKITAGASAEDVALTEQQLQKAQNDYDSLARESEIQTKVYREKTLDSLNNSVFYVQTAMNTIYNDLLEQSVVSTMSVSDNTLQNKVLGEYAGMKTKFDSLRAAIDSAKAANGDQVKIIAAADAARDYLNQLSTYLDSSYSLADKILVNSFFSQSEKEAIKADISAQQSANASSLTAVQSARSALINGAASYVSQIQAASNSISIAQAQLDLKTSGPRDFDIASAQAQVAQAQAALDKARSDAADYYISAPIDGKVTQVNYAIGETPTGAEAVVKMLGNERYEIKVDIAESDITKIKVGDKTIIELDSFGSDHPFSGAVTFIDPAQTIIKDVTYYKTTIAFNQDSWSDQIKPGMTANITISSAEKSDVLFIPQRAVKVRASTLGEVPKKYVEVRSGDKTSERDVEIGLRGDDGLVEIISGLSEGENVITFRKDNSK